MGKVRKYQYVRDGYTMVRLEVNAEKVKVGYGEIIESDRSDIIYFTSNGFNDVTDGLADLSGDEGQITTPENVTDMAPTEPIVPAAPEVPEVPETPPEPEPVFKIIDDLTVAQLKDIATEKAIDLGDATKKADIVEKVVDALTGEQIAEILAAANAAA